METGVTQSHFLIQTMDGKRSEYIMDLVTCSAHFLYSREQDRLVIKIAYYKFFYWHIILFKMSKFICSKPSALNSIRHRDHVHVHAQNLQSFHSQQHPSSLYNSHRFVSIYV